MSKIHSLINFLLFFPYGNRNDGKDCKAAVVAAATTVAVVVVLAGNFILHFCFTQFALL